MSRRNSKDISTVRSAVPLTDDLLSVTDPKSLENLDSGRLAQLVWLFLLSLLTWRCFCIVLLFEPKYTVRVRVSV